MSAAPLPPRRRERGARPAVASGMLLAVATLAVVAPRLASAYYVPGTYPQEFYERDPLQPYVNSLTSQVTEVRAWLWHFAAGPFSLAAPLDRLTATRPLLLLLPKQKKTQLPYEHYTMPFCRPAEGIQRIGNTANLGTILSGLRIENSPYMFHMMVRHVHGLVANDAASGPALFCPCGRDAPPLL